MEKFSPQDPTGSITQGGAMTGNQGGVTKRMAPLGEQLGFSQYSIPKSMLGDSFYKLAWLSGVLLV